MQRNSNKKRNSNKIAQKEKERERERQSRNQVYSVLVSLRGTWVRDVRTLPILCFASHGPFSPCFLSILLPLVSCLSFFLSSIPYSDGVGNCSN